MSATETAPVEFAQVPAGYRPPRTTTAGLVRMIRRAAEWSYRFDLVGTARETGYGTNERFIVWLSADELRGVLAIPTPKAMVGRSLRTIPVADYPRTCQPTPLTLAAVRPADPDDKRRVEAVRLEDADGTTYDVEARYYGLFTHRFPGATFHAPTPPAAASWSATRPGPSSAW